MAGLFSRRGQSASSSDRGADLNSHLDPPKASAGAGFFLPDFAEGLSFLGIWESPSVVPK